MSCTLKKNGRESGKSEEVPGRIATAVFLVVQERSEQLALFLL